MYSFIYLFIYLFIHLFIYSFIYLFIYSFIHLFIYSFIHLFIYSFIQLFIYYVSLKIRAIATHLQFANIPDNASHRCLKHIFKMKIGVAGTTTKSYF